jgi:hypothetical protein
MSPFSKISRTRAGPAGLSADTSTVVASISRQDSRGLYSIACAPMRVRRDSASIRPGRPVVLPPAPTAMSQGGVLPADPRHPRSSQGCAETSRAACIRARQTKPGSRMLITCSAVNGRQASLRLARISPRWLSHTLFGTRSSRTARRAKHSIIAGTDVTGAAPALARSRHAISAFVCLRKAATVTRWIQ